MIDDMIVYLCIAKVKIYVCQAQTESQESKTKIKLIFCR